MDIEDIFAGAIVGLVGAIVIAFLWWGIGTWSCWKDFSDSKYDYRFKYFKGCQYDSGSEGWLPGKRLRNIN